MESENKDNPDWQAVTTPAEVAAGTLKAIKREGRHLLLGRTSDGCLFAVDGRCPHEGYPLVQGELEGNQLTCCWHNWIFDVRDGSCVLGGEGVRTFPVRERAGSVEVDLAEPDPATLISGLRASLEEGLERHENDRAIRDGVRLLELGYDPWRLLGDLARYDARHAEYGSTHALAVSADCGRMLARYTGADAMYAIAPAIDLCGDENQRLPERRHPDPLAGATLESFRAAAEARDVEGAEGLLRGALDAGVDRATAEHWLYTVFSDHFTGFGHELIYIVKAQELVDRAGDEYAREILPALLFKALGATREDTLPYMRPYRRRLEAVEAELADVHGRARADTPFEPEPVRDAVLDGTRGEAFDAVWSALVRGVPAATVARALIGAAAQRLFRFDTEVDADPLVAENWLWATHRFTFASAVRNATLRFRSPDALRFLFQAVAFVHSGKGMDTPAERRAGLERATGSSAEIGAAIAAHDVPAALGMTLGWLRDERPMAELRATLEDLCLRDPLVRPIFLAHAIKTTCAAFEEHEALAAHPDREWPLLAAVRFLASPIDERRFHATVTDSIRWVRDGIMPRKLTQ